MQGGNTFLDLLVRLSLSLQIGIQCSQLVAHGFLTMGAARLRAICQARVV